MSLGDDDARDGATVDGAKPKAGPDFAVVGLAAAAGGVEALTSFFENMPDANGMAFIVVLRLSDDQESQLDSALQRVTTMPVLRVQESTPIEPDHVYVISPALQLSMSDGRLDVDRANRLQGRPTAIDVFLRAHAEVHRTRAVSVILSGAGTDGAVGIARVKECGGVTFAQRLDEAAESAMPRAAIETGTVDFVMSVADMPSKMVEVAENSKRIRLPPDPDVDPVVDRVDDPDEIALADEALRDILVTVRARTHHDFAHFRRGALLRRIERRMQVHAIPDLPCYRDYLREHVPESGALTQDLLISVTNFFRDRLAYLALERALRSLMEDRSARDPVRIWVAGCATGEEAYAIAIIALEVAESFPTRPDVQVFATDIDERAISTGRAGLYPSSIAADVSRERLRRFFTKEGDRYRVSPVVSDSVLFAVHNVLRDPPFARLDLICCRNLLVYLDRDVQAHLMRTFRFALKPGGILFLGTSEFAESVSDAFVPVDARERIYRASVEAPLRAPRFDAPSPHPTEPREPAGSSHAQRHQHALDRLGPPSILVDASHDILHVSENAGRFLHHDGGRPSQHLVNNVAPALREALQSALSEAERSGRSVESHAVRLERDGQPSQVGMAVFPVDTRAGAASAYLVVFSEVQDTLRDAGTAAAASADVTRLEDELRQLESRLQDTVEDAETSTEELKAANEALQAMNGALRAANDRLRASEAQLQTANAALKVELEASAALGDDASRQIASTDIATVFVDNLFRIERYTPRALDVFNLMPVDVGRSLLDINHRLDYPMLSDDVAQAMNAPKTVERRVDSIDGRRRYLVRALAYRRNGYEVSGAVITFIDVTALRDAEGRLRLAAETTRDYAIMTVDDAGTITGWNVGGERVFGYGQLEMVGKSDRHPLHAGRSRARHAGDRTADGTRTRPRGRRALAPAKGRDAHLLQRRVDPADERRRPRFREDRPRRHRHEGAAGPSRRDADAGAGGARAVRGRQQAQGRAARRDVARAEAPAEPDPRQRRAPHATARRTRRGPHRARRGRDPQSRRRARQDHRRPARPVAFANGQAHAATGAVASRRRRGADRRRLRRRCGRPRHRATLLGGRQPGAGPLRSGPRRPARVESAQQRGQVHAAGRQGRRDDRPGRRLGAADGRRHRQGHRPRVPAARLRDVHAGTAGRDAPEGRAWHRTRARQRTGDGPGRARRGDVGRGRRRCDVPRLVAAGRAACRSGPSMSSPNDRGSPTCGSSPSTTRGTPSPASSSC